VSLSDSAAALLARIEAALAAAGGALPFADYMQMALNEPGLGYYHRRQSPIGPGGDFTTAPELGALFATALARGVVDLQQAFDLPAQVLELGAGSGALAADLLAACRRLGHPQVGYAILEPSAALAQDQRTRLAEEGAVVWLQRLPEAFSGVIVANEVLDALPVDCFVVREAGLMQRAVAGNAREGFRWVEIPAPVALQRRVAGIEAALGRTFEPGYASEWSPWLVPFVRSLAARLERGAIVFCDYGYERRDYYHPERSQGTLVCHARHRAHDDPFRAPGAEDISAWVDFEAVAEAALAAGLRVHTFETQTQFLVRHGLLEALTGAQQEAASTGIQVALARQAERLLLPGEMGTRFKVLVLVRARHDSDIPDDAST